MGLASLGFPNGPSMTFRIDPTMIDYNYQVQTSVTNTVGGRVVQVLGATLSDVTVSGDIGEDRTLGGAPFGSEHPGVSWKLAEAFFAKVQAMMMQQSADSNVSPNAGQTAVLNPATFIYAPKGLHFQCYIKGIIDPDGDGTSGVTHKVGRSNYRYQLVLFPVLTETIGLQVAGSSNGVLDAAKAAAIDAYINRISQGIGWRFTAYNGGVTVPASTPSTGTTATDPSTGSATPAPTPPPRAGGGHPVP